MMLSVNDPVHVTRSDGGQPFEGVVAYVGKVNFDNSGTEEWVGVRLTGSSIGLGKNNGTVNGKQYMSRFMWYIC
jgi:dynactin 1